MPPRRLGPTAVSRAFPSLARSILTEIYLCKSQILTLRLHYYYINIYILTEIYYYDCIYLHVTPVSCHFIEIEDGDARVGNDDDEVEDVEESGDGSPQVQTAVVADAHLQTTERQ
jgi:hypothetical protein